MKILLGSIVTQMAGSVAGQTVRRFRGGFVLQNKVQRKASFAYIKNARLAFISSVFSAWSLFDSSTRELWNKEAGFYLFKDKFGNDKYLSGREFFTKLTTQASWADLPAPSSSDLKSEMYDWELNFSSASFASSEVLFSVVTPVNGWQLVTCVQPLRSLARNTDPYRAPRLEAGPVSSGDTLNIFSKMQEAFPLMAVTSVFQVVCYQVTESGFVSAPVWFSFRFDS